MAVLEMLLALLPPLAFNEVYQALATGAVDGQDNPSYIVDKNFYEVTNCSHFASS